MHAHTAPQRPWIMDKRIEDVWRKAVRLAWTHMHAHTAHPENMDKRGMNTHACTYRTPEAMDHG
jgi:hypothetical protein